MAKRDYYEALGISKDADKQAIKKAYRKLAKEYHPDRNKDKDAEDKFKEVQEAYDVLMDDQKRAAYDQYGFAGTQGFGGGGGFDPNGFSGFDFDGSGIGDIFEQFFGRGFGFSGGAAQQRRPKGADIEVNLKINFAEGVFGAEKTIKYKRFVPCSKCKGTGAENGETVVCPTCNGQGQVVTNQRTFFGQIQAATICPTCQGQGRVIKEKCTKCNGEGREKIDDTLIIKIPPAIPDTVTMRFRNRGNVGVQGGEYGDLYVNIEVGQHESLERRGDDIYLDWDIDVVTAVLGGEVVIPTVNGDITIKVTAGTQPEKVIRLTGKGGPKYKDPSKNGDQYVRFRVIVPQKLTAAQRKLWEQLRETSDGKAGWFR